MSLWRKTKTGKPEAKLPSLQLDSQRIVMRPPKESDFESWREVRARNRMHLKPFEPSWPENCLAPDFYKARLRRQTRDWLNDHAYAFLVFEQNSDTLIGGMNINNVMRGVSQNASLGYWVAREKQGQGYMAETMRLTLHYCFTSLTLHRVHASCLLHNTRSQNLLSKAGFIQEGKAKKYLKIDGHWQDHLLFGLCREDWQESQTNFKI